jgi:hypothetical protein
VLWLGKRTLSEGKRQIAILKREQPNGEREIEAGEDFRRNSERGFAKDLIGFGLALAISSALYQDWLQGETKLRAKG